MLTNNQPTPTDYEGDEIIYILLRIYKRKKYVVTESHKMWP